MPVTAPFTPAKTLDSGHRELIDQLMNSTAPAWFLTARDERPALLAAMDDDLARDYLASGCATVDGAWQVFDLLNTLERCAATRSQEATTAAILALATYALNWRDHGCVYLDRTRDIDPQHPFVELILTQLDSNGGAQSFRSAAAALGSRIEVA